MTDQRARLEHLLHEIEEIADVVSATSAPAASGERRATVPMPAARAAAFHTPR